MSQREPIEGELAEPASVKQAGAVQAYQEPPASSNPFDADPARFALQIRQRGENYSGLVSWLCEHMVIGEDLVQVHVVKRDKCDPRQTGCSPSTNPWHWSDPELSKKGAEKICGLLGLGVRFLGMDDFRRMALKGVAIQDVIVDCELYAGADHRAVSQGTGACNIGEVQGSLNNAMKRAAKRAHVDAVKRVAGLSGIATEIKRRMPPVDPERAAQGLPPKDAPAPADDRTEAERGRYSSGAKLTHCPIGKHKNKPWREVPSDYLEWVCRELTNKPDLVKAAGEELKKRRASADGSSSIRTPPPPLSPEERLRGQGEYRGPLASDDGRPSFDDDIPF